MAGSDPLSRVAPLAIGDAPQAVVRFVTDRVAGAPESRKIRFESGALDDLPNSAVLDLPADFRFAAKPTAFLVDQRTNRRVDQQPELSVGDQLVECESVR